MCTNANNIQNFPIEKLTKKWPFSKELADDLFFQSFKYSSLKNFLFDMIPEDAEALGSEKTEEETDFLYNLPYDDFSIENDQLYYNDYLKDTKYTLKNISYNIIICEPFRHFLNDYLKQKNDSKAVWMRVLGYLLNARFSVLEVLKEENYIKNNKQNILQGFCSAFKQLDHTINLFWKKDLQTSETEKLSKIRFYEEKLLNIFLYCEFARSDSEVLVENFFIEKSYKNIIVYYECTILDLFQMDI